MTDGCGIWIGTGTKAFYATKGNDDSIKLVANPHEDAQNTCKIERRFCTQAEYSKNLHVRTYIFPSLAKQVLIFGSIKMGNFCQQVLKPL